MKLQLRDQSSELQIKMNKKLMQLEGQCKIQQVVFLKINLIKSVLIIIPSVLCVIPIFLIFYYKWFRVLIFYSEINYLQASHVYVKSKDGLQEITKIFIQKNNQQRRFEFKKLTYQIVNQTCFVPVGYKYMQNHKKILSQEYLSKGMSNIQVSESKQKYGKNQHNVDIPSYPSYIFAIMIQPFFILQYFTSAIYFIQGFVLFAIMMITASFITTTINYILLYIAFLKIKQMAEDRFNVQVLRQKELRTVSNTQIVPGDIYKLGIKIPCDSLMLKGEAYLNEASLTGQSVPIGKFPVIKLEQFQQTKRWLFEGSDALLKNQDSFAIALDTGYKSRRGRIIRKILNRNPKQPQFFGTLIRFLFLTLLVGTILYLVTLPFLLTKQFQAIMIVFRYFDFVTYSFPAPFPIFFNIAYSFCLIRLKFKLVFGTQPQKTVESAHLKTLCFDKTGTLTQNKVSIHSIYLFENNENYLQLKSHQVRQNEIYYKIFGSCHSVKLINNQLQGDQIDLRMFQYTKLQINPQNQNKFYKNKTFSQNQNFQIQIVRLNQYQSKFQSMSVLVKINNEYFIFVKGAPQKIHSHSLKKYEYFQKLLKSLSLKGFRSISFGYRKVKFDEVQFLTTCDRQEFLKNILTIGLVAFQNHLKNETQQTIQHVLQSNIQPKMITGDNLFIAIQTASRASILSSTQQILIFEGKKQAVQNLTKGFYIGTILKRHQTGELFQKSVNIQIQTQFKAQKISIAVDNDFLMLKNKPYLVDRIKVFARISPQNKAYIVKMLKQQIQNEYDSRTKTQKIFGSLKKKVGMVGDGANDLIAIRQADVGIGFCDTDASYGSSFTVQNLSSIDLIIRQSKNVQSQIIQMVRYYGLNSFFRLGLTILLTDDSTYFTSNQLTYNALAASILITVLMGLTRPSQTKTKYAPCTNFLGIQHNLVFWGQIIIYSIGVTVGYIVFKNCPDFVSNPSPIISISNGYNGITDSTTAVWLMSFWSYLSLPIIIYKSEPWKQPIYKNILLSIIIGLNILIVLVMHFANAKIKSILDLVQITKKQSLILLGIMVLTMIISLSFQQIINRFNFHEKQFQSNENIKKNQQIKGQLDKPEASPTSITIFK